MYAKVCFVYLILLAIIFHKNRCFMQDPERKVFVISWHCSGRDIKREHSIERKRSAWVYGIRWVKIRSNQGCKKPLRMFKCVTLYTWATLMSTKHIVHMYLFLLNCLKKINDNQFNRSFGTWQIFKHVHFDGGHSAP